MTEILLSVNPPVTNDQINILFTTAWEYHRPADFQQVLKRSLLYVCALDEELLVGFVNVAWDGGKHAFLLDTTVHGQFQRRGIGRNLVLRAIEETALLEVEWLHVDFEPHLRGFYEQCGFRKTEAGLMHLRSQ